MKKVEFFLDWLIKRPWFWGAFLFLGLFISGNIQSKIEFFSILTMCLILWLFDSLFLKKSINVLLKKVSTIFKREA